MFKVLLVDDEEEVRKGIRDRIDWPGFGLEVVGEAENGREALEFFDETIPDIVITDINMPFMDGLELTEKIRAGFPNVKIIILTGFDDFKFAQTAIKFGVSDYILKPVLPADINKLLDNLSKQLMSETVDREDVEKLKKYYEESLPVIKENYLMSLVLGKTSMEDTELIRESDVRLEGNWFSASICKIDSETVKKTSASDLKIKRFTVFNIVNEELDRHGRGSAFMFDDGIIIILPSVCNEREAARNRMLGKLDDIRASVERFTDHTVSIGMGRIVDDINDTRQSYLSAVTARKYKTILSGNKVIFVEDLEPGLQNYFHLDEAKEEELVTGIRFGNHDKIDEAVNHLFNEIEDKSISMKDYQLYFMEITSSVMKLARLFEIASPEIIPEGSGLLMEFEKFNSISQARDWIRQLSINLMDAISRKRRDSTQVLYERAMHYLNENYGDQDLNVNKLASHLFISPSYMNLIFKKQSGTTFLKTLTSIRLEKAKLMLLDSNNKIADVAAKVGYPDISYFSYFFKKKTGTSPREYKKTAMPEGK